MDIKDSWDIIEGVFKEYVDTRNYNKYCLDNLLLQLDGKGINYIEYLKLGGVINKSNLNNKPLDVEKVKKQNNDILERYKRGELIT